MFQGKEGKKEGRGTFSKMLGKWKLREDTHTHTPFKTKKYAKVF